MSKELEQIEKWIDENKGTALHPIMGNNPSITQLFIDTLLQKITELKAEEGIEVSEAVEFVDWINNNEINGQYYRHQRLNIWNGDYNPDERHYSPLTTQQLYDLFKSKNK